LRSEDAGVGQSQYSGVITSPEPDTMLESREKVGQKRYSKALGVVPVP